MFDDEVEEDGVEDRVEEDAEYVCEGKIEAELREDEEV